MSIWKAPVRHALASGVLAVALAGIAGAATAGDESGPAEIRREIDRQWQFRVLLDGSEIGKHRFELAREGERKLLHSEAEFNVKFLFFNAYSYRHENTERWSGDCLQQIHARTVTNGKLQKVVGEQTGDGFVIRGEQETRELPQCVMTFAYWNPDFLAESRLLNPQTGEFLDVDVTELPEEQLEVRGETVAARPYRVVARDMELEVWYSRDKEWLALESTAKGGRKIRYELI